MTPHIQVVLVLERKAIRPRRILNDDCHTRKQIEIVNKKHLDRYRRGFLNATNGISTFQNYPEDVAPGPPTWISLSAHNITPPCNLKSHLFIFVPTSLKHTICCRKANEEEKTKQNLEGTVEGDFKLCVPPEKNPGYAPALDAMLLSFSLPPIKQPLLGKRITENNSLHFRQLLTDHVFIE